MAGIKDIAKKAGVSIGTVDRVLHNRGRFAQQTKDKVLEAVRELNYQPNLNARRLKHKEPCRILVLMADLNQDQGYWSVCLKGIEQARMEFESIGVDVVLKTYDRYSPKSFREAASELKQRTYSGVLIAPLIPDESRKLIEENKEIPFVIFDCPLSDTEPWLKVLQDPYLGGKTAARLISHMVDKKHATAAISYESPNPHQDLRAQGYCDLMVELGHKKPDHHIISHEFNESELAAHLSKYEINLENYKALFISKTGVHKYASLLLDSPNRPLLIGYDLVQENIDALKRGEIDFLISQNSSAQTYLGLKRLANSLLDGHELEKEDLPMTVDILNRENIDLYLFNH